MKVLFMCVDAQKDFIMKDGLLAIEGAEAILPSLEILSELAMSELAVKNNITVMNTGDDHDESDEELSDNPDFVKTFPKHCMSNTDGAEFVAEAKLHYPIVIPFDMSEDEFNENEDLIKNADEIVMTKQYFDISTSPHAERVLKLINPDVVFVYGVATNVCVDFAVKFLLKLGYKVYVALDGMKELQNIPMDDMLQDWVDNGVKYASVNVLIPDYARGIYEKMKELMPEEQKTIFSVEHILDNMENE